MAQQFPDMHAMYVRLGFTGGAANELLIRHQFTTIESLSRLRSDDDVDEIHKLLTRPGGLIPNPQVAGTFMPNPGFEVSVQAILNLKLAVYFIKHRKRCSRPTVPADVDVTPESILGLEEMRESEKAYKDDPLPAASEIFNEKDWTKTIESLTDLLASRKGTTGLPLAWVVREGQAVTDDPNPNAADFGWATVEEEMINRAPMLSAAGDYTAQFKADNKKVWDIISTLTRNLTCRVVVDPLKRSCDGRAAFLALKQEFLGPHHYRNQAAAAEKALEDAEYKGETKRHNFNAYVRTHMEQHVILETLARNNAHAGIHETTKTRLFIKGIKHPALQSAIIIANASDNIKNNFKTCTAFFRDNVRRLAADTNPSLNVSSATTSNGRRGNKSNNGNGNALPPIEESQVVLKHYTSEQYKRLTPAAKKKLSELRTAAGITGTNNKRKGKNGSNGRNKKQRTSNVSSVSFQDDDSIDEHTGADDSTVSTSNRNNPNLTRQPSSRQR